MFKKIIISFFMFILPLTANAELSDMDMREMQEMRQEVLMVLYANNPETRKLITDAEGYAVFKNQITNLVFLSAGTGKGVVHDTKSGEDIYMKMATGGFGLGLGAKGYSTIIIFHKRAMFDRFISKGWDFNTQVDAAAKINDMGGEVIANGSFLSGITVYNITDNAVLIQAILQGSKHWKWK